MCSFGGGSSSGGQGGWYQQALQSLALQQLTAASQPKADTLQKTPQQMADIQARLAGSRSLTIDRTAPNTGDAVPPANGGGLSIGR